MSQSVSLVKSVCFSIDKSNPPQLAVNAIGTVNSSGWKNGVLVPVVYVVQPLDGIQDFHFVADAPAGIVLWVMSPISGDGKIELESWMKGVRIHSATNSLVVLLNEPACAVGQGVLVDHHLQAASGHLGEVPTDPGSINDGPRGPKGK